MLLYFYTAPVSIASLERTGDFQPIFTLKCTSTGSPATAVTWTKDGVLLTNSEVIHMSQLLTDGTTATYSNLLSFDALPSMVVGLYSCTVDNDFGAATQTITFTGVCMYVCVCVCVCVYMDPSVFQQYM